MILDVEHDAGQRTPQLIDFAKSMPALIRSLPKGTYYLDDQLRRALSSSILNLAEGNARTSHKERGRFFDISLGSIAEVASIIDVICAYGYITARQEDGFKSVLRRAYAMIVNLKKCRLNLGSMKS